MDRPGIEPVLACLLEQAVAPDLASTAVWKCLTCFQRRLIVASRHERIQAIELSEGQTDGSKQFGMNGSQE